MNVENTTQLTELRKALGPDVVLGLIDLRDVTIVADCRTGSSSPETDFADQNPRPSQRVFGVACARLDEATLCAILFRKRAVIERFWADNPKTRTGLVTRWPGVMVLWLRVAGVVPRNLGFGEFTWCSLGIVPVGAPDIPIDDFVVQSGQVPVVDFRDLRWQEPEREAIEIDLLEQEIGPRFRKTSRRRVLNLAFWSGLLERQFKPNYDPSLEKFQLRMANTQTTVWLGESAMVDAVFRWLEKLSKVLTGFPPGELRLARAKELARMLKNSVTRGQPSEGEVIDRFLQQQVEVCQGMRMTSRQLWVGFRAFCQTNKLPLCPKTILLHLVREKIRQRFGVGHSHDRIPGENDNPRFYRNLALKSSAAVVVQLSDAVVNRIHLYGTNN